MKNRTVIAILAVAGALVAYIAFFESERMTTTELDERKNRVFVDYRRGDVDALTIVSTNGERTELEKTEPKVPGAEPSWVVASAGSILADETEVRGVLAALDYLLVDRAVEGEGVREESRFGLQEPRLRGSFTINDKKTGFTVGAEAPGEKVYVAVESRPDAVFAVDADFLESVDKTTAELRSKRLVWNDLDRAQAVDVETEKHELAFEKRGGAWHVVAPGGGSVMADRDEVQKLLHAVFELEAIGFEADGKPEEIAAAAGLDTPEAKISVALPGGEKIALRVGQRCEGGPGTKAMREGSGTVACIGEELPALLEREAPDYWETTPAPVPVEEVQRVAVRRGKAQLILVKSESGRWTAEPDAPFPLGDEAVRELLELVSKTKAAGVHTGEDAAAAFGEKIGSLNIETVEGMPDFELEILAPGDSGLVGLRRSGEEIVLAAAGSIAEKLSADPLVYRRRSFEVCGADRIRRIEIDGEVDQVLEKGEEGWQVVSPVEMDADEGAAGRLAKALAEPEVESWVRVGGPKELGLRKDGAFARVAITCSAGDKDRGHGDEDDRDSKTGQVVLTFGDVAKEGGRYAGADVLGTDVAFVATEIDRYLERPLVTRDLLRVTPHELSSVTIEAGGRTVEVDRVDGSWVAKSAAGFDPDRFDRMLIDMSAMRIVKALSYGEARPRKETTAILVFEPAGEEGEPIRLWIGPPSADPGDDGYLARRDDLRVTVVIPARIVDGLLAAAGAG